MIFTVVGETLHDFVPKIPQNFAHACNFVSVMQLLFKCKMNAMLIVHYLVLMYLLHILPPILSLIHNLYIYCLTRPPCI